MVWYDHCMTFSLAFSNLDAAAPRQRARCAATGRFVAWSKVPQLRVPGAPRVVVIPSPLVVDGGDAVEVPVTVEAPPVVSTILLIGEKIADAAGLVVGAGRRLLAGTGRRLLGGAGRRLLAGARTIIVAGGLTLVPGAVTTGLHAAQSGDGSALAEGQPCAGVGDGPPR